MEYLYIHGVNINRINLSLPRFHKYFQHCIIIYTSIYTMKIPAAFIVAQILSSADAFSSYNFPTNRAPALPTLPQSASLSSSSPIFFQQQTKSPRSKVHRFATVTATLTTRIIFSTSFEQPMERSSTPTEC